MAALITPIEEGFVPVVVLPIQARGLTKGTLFWTVDSGYTGDMYRVDGIYSSANGVDWTDRTTEAMTALGWNNFDTSLARLASPVSIENVFACYVQLSGPDITVNDNLWIISYSGSAWSKVNVSDKIQMAATDTRKPLKVANGILFFMAHDGLYSSTDGFTWTQAFSLPETLVGGPSYSIAGITYGNGIYGVISNISYPTGQRSTLRHTSANLATWTEYSAHLPGHPRSGGSVQNLYTAGGRFYLDWFYTLYESSDFVTWTIIDDEVGNQLLSKHFPLSNGFLTLRRPLNWVGTSDILTWLPYSKTVITDTTTAFDYALPNATASIIGSASSDDGVIILSGYMYFFSEEDGIHTVKYNAAWDANDGVPPDPPDPPDPDPPVLTLFTLPDAVINVNISTALGTVADGAPPIVWSGSVTNPGGTSVYTITSEVLNHTFVALGTHTVFVTVTDDLGRTSTGTTTLLVTDAGGTGGLSLVLTNPLPGATVNVPYSTSVGAVSGGTPPYSWALTAKSWADAASLSNTGVLATTFTTAGAETLTVTVTDSSSPAQSLARDTGLTVAENANTATIQGTLRLDTSDGAFAARDVYLYDYVNGAKIAETVSDGTTGAWQFTQVAPGEYFVVGVAHGDDLNIPRDFDALGVITVV